MTSTIKRDCRIGVIAGLLWSVSTAADPLHAIGAGAFQHHDSHWVFPMQIAGFERVGIPQDIDGGSDAVAYYARGESTSRTTVEVTLQSAVSPAMQADDSTAQRSFFAVGQGRVLTGVKTVTTLATGMQVNVYIIDTGAWIVQIKASAPRVPADLSTALDDFVREQRWESLELSDRTCTGAACAEPAAS